LTLPKLSEDTLVELRGILPPQAGLSNPIDMIASATPEQYEKVMGIVGRDPQVDSVVVIYIPPLVTNPEEIANAIARGAAEVPKDKPLATVFMSSKGAPEVLAQGQRGKIPSYSFPENAALALSAALQHSRFRSRPRGKVLTVPRTEERAIRGIVERSLDGATGGHAWLAAEDFAAVLGLLRIQVANTRPSAPTAADAVRVADEMGYPVAIKAVAPGLLHKTDAGGVAIRLRTPEEVTAAASTMAERVGKAGYTLEQFLVQRHVEGGVEALVGVTSDPGLGHIVVAGLGGVEVELFGDAAFRLPPVSDLDAKDMLDRIKARKLLDGFRGAPPADKEALVDVICKISALAEIVPELTELDLNPVKVLAQGNGAIVVDGRIRLSRTERG
jgi:acyl-CoA synthetase (NDP forming)